jgi:tetratricopeptide (TPR) repeat protein
MLRKIAIFLFFFLTSSLNFICAQDEIPEKYLEVRGISELEMEPLSRATASLYEGTTKIKSVTTGSDGSFTFKLDINKQYTIEVEKDGLISKRISFNTQMPEEENGTWMSEFSIGLVKPCSGIDYSVLKQPVDRVSFDAKRREYVSDKEYVNSLRPRIEALIIKTDQCLLQTYEDLIKKGDAATKQNNPQEAVKAYQEALKIYPTETYPSKRIAEINNTVEKQQVSSEIYNGLIAEADALANQGRLTEALPKYEKAGSMNPSESYPKQKITEIKSIIQEQQAVKNAQLTKDDKYNQAMAKASVAFTRKDYALAKQFYAEALEIKPGESLPKTRVQEIQNIESKKAADNSARAEEMAKKAAFDKEYLATVSQADQLFKEKKFEEAKAQYAKAMTMKPAESYPAQRVKVIDNAVSNEQSLIQKSKDDGYNAAMAAANNAIAKNQFELARQSYQKALTFRQDDLQAKQGIAEADHLAANFEKRKNLEEQYIQNISSADALIAQKKWTEAREMFNKALILKPGDKYAQTKITFIENTIAAEQATLLKSNEDAYNNAMATANNALSKNQFDQAKESYQKALTFKSDDLLAKKGLIETDRQEGEFVKRRNQDDQYNQLISSAENYLTQKNWPEARQMFNKALLSKPGDKYAQTKIAFIENSIAAEEAARDKAAGEEYKTAIALANKAAGQKMYDVAKDNLQNALSIKPGDLYALSRINEIDMLVAGEKKKAELEQSVARRYSESIVSADKLLAEKEYMGARASYSQALQLRPGDQYSTQKIASIDNLVAAEQAAKLRQTENTYTEAVNKGNALLASKNYTGARESYVQALSVKPGDNNAKLKISEADLLIKQDQDRIKAEQDKKKRFDIAVNTADQYYGQKNFATARSYYEQAIDIIPGETYPKQKLQESILALESEQKLLTEKKAVENAYSIALVNAEKYYKAKDYNQAKNEFSRALALKPDEILPKTKIAEIENLISARDKELSEAKSKADSYTAAINAASEAFAKKNYSSARESYLIALKSIPGDVLATDQIKKIDYLMAEAEKMKKNEDARQTAFTALIKSADGLFDQAQYANAKTEYKKALALDPASIYAKQRITRIDEINRLLSQTPTKTNQQSVQTAPRVIAAIPMGELNFKNESEKQLYMTELVKKYPSGITLETYKEKYKETYRYIVIRNNQAQEFRHVRFTTYNGLQYSVNGKPITQQYFNSQTKVREGENFKEIVMQ